MADNTARARTEIRSMRRAVADHVAKWRRYTEPHDKQFAAKTVSRVQADIARLKQGHPSLRNDSSWEDTWTPRNG